MAKNKRSKILAMALCAGVMAGIYASPVMAKEISLDSNSSVTTETTTSTGGYTQNEVRVNISDGISSDTIGTFYSNEEEAGFKTDYTMTASTFTLEAGGKTWASLTVDGLTYTNQNTLNNVRLTADGLTFSNLSNLEDAAVLNAAAINSWNEKTQNINAERTVAGKTYFDGKVIADKFGTYTDGFYVDENGELKSNKIIVHKGEFTVDRNGAVKAANGAFTVDKFGNTVSKGDVTSTAADGTTTYTLNTIGANTAGIRREGDENSGGHRTIIEEQLVVNRDTGVISNIGGSFTVDRGGKLVASTLGNRSGTFGVDESGNVVGATIETADGANLDEVKGTADQALGKAENAQSTADQALGKAENAQSTADQALGKAENAQSTADQALGKAENAQSTADQALGKAENAQSTADQALGKAENAQSTADQALGKAENAQSTADQALSKAENAQETADRAEDKADAAQATADQALGKAENAQSTADQALDKAENAQSTADQALEKAESGQATADTALDKAQDAQNTADMANTKAETAQSTADQALGKAETAQSTADRAWNKAESAQSTADMANTKADRNTAAIGDISILDPEIAGDSNNDGQNDVVGAVNNEAQIRREEISRVDGRIDELNNRVGELEDRIDKVGAMAAAIANLRTMGYDPAAPTEVAVGIGQYRDETGAALGLFHYPNRDFMLSLSVSTSGDEVMGGIGATWKFGRKSPEKVAEIKKAQAEADARRAEEAKLAKAEEMKQAAKEAKIKAQQERHAKLAAERAAQAEAAK